METLLSKGQLSCICAMMHKLKIQGQPVEDMVRGFSDGRTGTRTELSMSEAKEMIKHLKSLDPDEQVAEKMRRKIISLAHEMGWRLVKKVDNAMVIKADMQRVDNWCMRYGYLHKKLNQYQRAELPKLLTQFEVVYKQYLNGVYIG